MDERLHAAVPGCAGSLSLSDLVFGCVSCNPCIAPSLFLWLPRCHVVLPVCVLTVSFTGLLFVLFTALLCTVQVIYKKFNVPCPFVDFAFNATTSGLNVNATDPGGEDPACIPKMANLNSQVGLPVLHRMKLPISLHCHGH